jgi:hypothetical protein
VTFCLMSETIVVNTTIALIVVSSPSRSGQQWPLAHA